MDVNSQHETIARLKEALGLHSAADLRKRVASIVEALKGPDNKPGEATSAESGAQTMTTANLTGK